MEQDIESDLADEIDITPEMIEAGIEAFCRTLGDDPYEEIVTAIYLAMWGQRLRLHRGTS